MENKLFCAQRGRGAFLNGEPLHVSGQEGDVIDVWHNFPDQQCQPQHYNPVSFGQSDISRCVIVTEIGPERDDLALSTMTSNIYRLLRLPVHGWVIEPSTLFYFWFCSSWFLRCSDVENVIICQVWGRWERQQWTCVRWQWVGLMPTSMWVCTAGTLQRQPSLCRKLGASSLIQMVREWMLMSDGVMGQGSRGMGVKRERAPEGLASFHVRIVCRSALRYDVQTGHCC